MKKTQQKNNKVPLIFIAIFVLVIVVAILIKFFYVPMKTYHSKLLKITIDYPAKYELEERFGTITLKNKNGEIILDRVGTNEKSLFYNFNEQKLIINSLESKKFISTYSDSQKSLEVEHRGYQFYKNYAVYSIYTKNKSLYPDLDRIAHSFRYEP